MSAAEIAATGAASLRARMVTTFALQGVVMATLNMRIPDLQVRAGLSDADLGLVLMGGPIGALAVFVAATPVVERLGTRRTMLVTYPLIALFAALFALTTQRFAMFAILAAYGACNSVGNVAINVEADRVEAATGARLMNRCHGAWSVVFFAASALAGLARGAGVDPALQLVILAPAFALVAALLIAPTTPCPARAHGGGARGAFARPTMRTLALVGFCLGVELLEASSRVWATIYLRDEFDVSAFVQSAAAPALVASMAAGRLVADRIVEAYGPVRVGAGFTALAFAGLLVVVAATNPYVVILGFSLAGLGSAVGYPLMVSAAARLGDRSATENVAATSLLIQLVMLVAPMLIGFVAQGFGVRAAFACLLPVVAAGVVLARRL